jgi:hypothetical protein
MTHIKDQLHQMTNETAGKVLVGIGGSGTLYQSLVEAASEFLIWGNVTLLAGGLWLMFSKIFDRRRDRRTSD